MCGKTRYLTGEAQRAQRKPFIVNVGALCVSVVMLVLGSMEKESVIPRVLFRFMNLRRVTRFRAIPTSVRFAVFVLFCQQPMQPCL